MPQESLWEKINRHSIALILFFLFSTHLWLAALKKPLWGDEVMGLSGTLNNSFSQLLKHGPIGEASPSPLPYLIEKTWLHLWGNSPQVYWDLNLFFRFFPVLFWALAAIGVYYFVESLLVEQAPRLRFISRVLIASAAATFYHSGGFGSYYALESRSYSPWLFFSTLHACYFLRALTRDLTRKEWFFYGIVSALLTFTTYVATAQIALAFFFQWLQTNQRREGKYLSISARTLVKNAWPSATILFLCALIAANYFAKVPSWGFKPPSWQFFWECLIDVVAKAWHNHGKESFFVLFPLLAILIPWLWRKKTGIATLSFYAWSLLLLSVVLFQACLWKGNLFASRYLIFLTPIMTAIYFLGIIALAHGLSQIIRRIFPSLTQITAFTLLIIWAILEVGQRVPSYARAIHQDSALIYTYRVGEKSTQADCALPLTTDNIFPAEKAAAFNTYCRAISASTK